MNKEPMEEEEEVVVSGEPPESVQILKLTMNMRLALATMLLIFQSWQRP